MPTFADAHCRITVDGTERHLSQDDLHEHALYVLMSAYREQYGPDAAQAILWKLQGYYGQKEG